MSPTNIFAPASTPADSIFGLSIFVLLNVAAIFLVVFTLLTYVVVRFRHKQGADRSEPVQIYGSNQVELAWTVIPVLIVLALFLATARVIASVQNQPRTPGALEVTVIGHQFWWEYQYPSLNIVTANELHVPASDPAHPTPTFLTLLSADTRSWLLGTSPGWRRAEPYSESPESDVDRPHAARAPSWASARNIAGGTQHAKMLLRVLCCSRAGSSNSGYMSNSLRWTREHHPPDGGYLNRRRALTATRYRGRRLQAASART